MLITRRSPFTGTINTRDIAVTEAQMAEFALPNRRNIQDIFPNLSADDREFIKTGITPEEWAATFGSDEDDEGFDGDPNPLHPSDTEDAWASQYDDDPSPYDGTYSEE